MLELPAEFTPTAFLATSPGRPERPAALDLALAHEVGHAFGLDHEGDRLNLMSTETKTCWPRLTAERASRLDRGMKAQ